MTIIRIAIVGRNAAIDGTAHSATRDELLARATDIDAVALCTPPQVCRAQAEAALKAGRHVLLEKPPGATVSELDPLIAGGASDVDLSPLVHVADDFMLGRRRDVEPFIEGRA